MEVKIDSKWMGDGTAYVWSVVSPEIYGGDGYTLQGTSGTLLEALRDIGNAVQVKRSWQGLEKLELVAVNMESIVEEEAKVKERAMGVVR